MNITLSPVADNKNDSLPVIDGQEVNYRGVSFNVTDEELPEFAKYDGETLTLLYHYDFDSAEPNQSPNIADYTFTPETLADPIARLPVEDENPLP